MTKKHAQPSPQGALTMLKISLGVAERGDFMTGSPTFPGDIIYPNERVVVYVHSCIWGGCPVHSSKAPASWQSKAGVNARATQRESEKLKSAGWRVLKTWECSVYKDAKQVAVDIIRVLDECKEPRPFDVSELAAMAHQDASSRVGAQAWRHLLEVMVQAGNHFRKGDVYYVLVGEEGWAEGAFEELWRVAKHHDIIKLTTNGYTQGALWDDALRSVGVEDLTGG
jgi:G:T-mismatch repair DNA endonuclease (very short patch repair protein)